MSDAVQIALIGALVVLIVFIISILVFRDRIIRITAGKEGIDIRLSKSEKQAATANLIQAEQKKEQQETSSIKQLDEARQRIDELEYKLKKTVLWADDYPSNNTYEVEALVPLGVEVNQVKSNAEAYKAIEKQSPDLVITDIGREGQPTNGLDLVSTLKDQKPELPVIVYTSFEMAENSRKEILGRGAQAVTAYPSELIQLVIDYLK